MPVLGQIRDRFATQRPAGRGPGGGVPARHRRDRETWSARSAPAAPRWRCARPIRSRSRTTWRRRWSRAAASRCGARRGESIDDYIEHVRALLDGSAGGAFITLDDGADLLSSAHARGGPELEHLIGGTEETTTGLLRLRHLHDTSGLRCPVVAVNEARTERALNDRHGTGQSALDGIVRATNMLLAGTTIVVVGYGWAGQGIAERARGAGAAVIVCEVDPLRALEARMAGYEVMPALQAASRGDLFITVTGSRSVLTAEHFTQMKDGATLANAGHFDVELDLTQLAAVAQGPPAPVRPLVDQFRLPDGRRLNLLARGRVRQPRRRRGASGRGDGRLVRAAGALRRTAGAASRGDGAGRPRGPRRG